MVKKAAAILQASNKRFWGSLITHPWPPSEKSHLGRLNPRSGSFGYRTHLRPQVRILIYTARSQVRPARLHWTTATDHSEAEPHGALTSFVTTFDQKGNSCSSRTKIRKPSAETSSRHPMNIIHPETVQLLKSGLLNLKVVKVPGRYPREGRQKI